MRHLMPFLAAATSIILSTGPACADLGDQLFRLLPEDGADGDNFGTSVGISAAIAIVGSNFDDDNGFSSGSAYLFDIITGQQLFKLKPNDGAERDYFGHSVAISGTTAVVGAPQDDDNAENSGSAYLFDTSTGQQRAKLLPKDGAENDEFGYAVAISDTTVIVGAYRDDDNGLSSGSAYLFDTTTGQHLLKLLPSDGAESDEFGWSVAISGPPGDEVAIFGALFDDDNGSSSGSAYLFDVETGEQLWKFLPDDGAERDRFGYSVAINGTIAIVGAAYDDDNGNGSGSAYLFDTTTGQQIAKLLPNDGAEGDSFGVSVAISGTIAIVSSTADEDNGYRSGSAYIFDIFDPANPIQIAKLLPDDGRAEDQFGSAVAISGETAIIGARNKIGNRVSSGAAFLFDAAGTIATLAGFSIDTGFLLDGALPDLESSNDAYIHTQSGFGETLVDLHNREMSILAEAPGNNPTILELIIESRIDEPAGLVQVRMKNFNTRDFDVVHTYSIGNTDAVEVISRLDASKYYNTNNGRMRVKIKHLVFVPFLAFTYESFIDQVEIVVY